MSPRNVTYESIDVPQSLPDSLTPCRGFRLRFIVGFGLLFVTTAVFSFHALENVNNASTHTLSNRQRGNMSRARFLTKYCDLIDPICSDYAESVECEECRLRRNPIIEKPDQPWYCTSPYLRERCIGGETLLVCLRCGLSEIQGKPLPLDVCATVIDECYFSLRNRMCFQCGFHRGWISANHFRSTQGIPVSGLKLPRISFRNRRGD